jgi:formylglycine-generating enzyme required for sulfatase activity
MEAPVDWEEDWPVFGVSWLDLMEYAAWRRRKTAYLFSLPLSVLWEKAARGADGRIYPWGNEFDPTFCNSNQTHEDGTRPCPVDSFPLDESPYGVRGLGGNSRDVCLNGPGEQFPAWCVSRGGDWSFSGFLHRCASQTGDTLTYVHNHFGGRLVLFPNSRIR